MRQERLMRRRAVDASAVRTAWTVWMEEYQWIKLRLFVGGYSVGENTIMFCGGGGVAFSPPCTGMGTVGRETIKRHHERTKKSKAPSGVLGNAAQESTKRVKLGMGTRAISTTKDEKRTPEFK